MESEPGTAFHVTERCFFVSNRSVKFFAGLRSSVEEHAKRKGYQDASGSDVAGGMVAALGLSAQHATCEMIYKLVEFRTAPRRVIAEKLAGWAFRLWLTSKE